MIKSSNGKVETDGSGIVIAYDYLLLVKHMLKNYPEILVAVTSILADPLTASLEEIEAQPSKSTLEQVLEVGLTEINYRLKEKNKNE